MNLIIYSIPVFFLLIGVELLITRMRGLSYYRFNDAITNLSCGIGSQITGIFLKVLTFDAYVVIFDHSPLKGKMPDNLIIYILLFIGVDFFYYWFHRLAHEISIIWGSHVVHHQSEEYNLTVALRQAWLQGAFSWVFYLPLAFLGFDPLMFVTIAAIQTLYQFWIHTKVIDRMPTWFEFVFNSPSHHRVHHGVNPKYIDRNHGGTLIIWDRMFGTFQEEEEEVVYGITTQPRSWNPLWLNFQYWGDLLRDASKADKPADAVKMLTLAPGWKPAGMGGMIRYEEINAKTFRKYDTEISSSLNYYVFFQFLVLLFSTTAFLFMGKDLTLFQQVGISVFIIYTVVCIGGIFERKRWVTTVEVLRVILITSIFAWIFLEYMPVIAAGICAGGYVTISVIWFLNCYKELNSTL